MKRSRRLTFAGIAAALALMAGVAFVVPAGAAAGLDPIAVAQAQLANCQRLAARTTSSAQRTRMQQCVADQTAILAILTPASPSGPPTTTPPATVPPTTAPPTTTPPTTVPPTTTPPPAPGGPCQPHPGACGYPDDTTTGVPAGTALTATGGFTANVAGKVYDGLDVTGCVTVAAPNVTIRNSRIQDNGCAWVVTGAAAGLVLDHVTVSCQNTPHKAVVVQKGGTLTAVRLSGCEDGAWFDPAGGTLQDSFIDGMFDNSAGTQQHTDVVQLAAGAQHVRILHNTLFNDDPSGSSVITDDTPGSADIVISGNLTAGGGWTIRYPNSGTAPDFFIVNNRMSSVWVQYDHGNGFLSGCSSCVTSVAGNIRDDTGAPIKAP